MFSIIIKNAYTAILCIKQDKKLSIMVRLHSKVKETNLPLVNTGMCLKPTVYDGIKSNDVSSFLLRTHMTK